MSPTDAVRVLLMARGCPESVVNAGLPGLVDAWDNVVRSVERGYELTLDDYLNDMDLRDLIAAAFHASLPDESARVADLLAAADARFRDRTVDSACLWGVDIASEEGLDPAREWWYYRRPVRPGDQLQEDLEGWGLAAREEPNGTGDAG